MAGYLRLRTAQWLVERLPPARAHALAQVLADAQWRRSGRDRRVVRDNLAVVLDRPVDDRSTLVRSVFRAFGTYLVEFLGMHRPPAYSVTVEGREHLRSATAGGRGAILLSGHVGNWELGAALVQRLGHRVAVVALSHLDRRTDALFSSQRRLCGVEVIPLGPQAARECLARLQAGQLVGLLGDRVLVRHGRPCRWFGRQVVLPTGPAVLSLRAGVAIVPTFAIRTPDGGVRLSFLAPLWPEGTAGGPDAVARLQQRCAAILERVIQDTPGQWLMFHPMQVLDGARGIVRSRAAVARQPGLRRAMRTAPAR